MDDAPSPAELARQLEPLASKLRALGEPLGADASLPPVQQLLPLVARLVVGVQYALNTTGDPHGTAEPTSKASAPGRSSSRGWPRPRWPTSRPDR